MELIFHYLNEVFVVAIRGKEIYFANRNTKMQMFPIEMLIDMDNSIKDKEQVKKEWRNQINRLNSEKEVEKYVKLELESKGWNYIGRR